MDFQRINGFSGIFRNQNIKRKRNIPYSVEYSSLKADGKGLAHLSMIDGRNDARAPACLLLEGEREVRGPAISDGREEREVGPAWQWLGSASLLPPLAMLDPAGAQAARHGGEARLCDRRPGKAATTFGGALPATAALEGGAWRL